MNDDGQKSVQFWVKSICNAKVSAGDYQLQGISCKAADAFLYNDYLSNDYFCYRIFAARGYIRSMFIETSQKPSFPDLYF
jgi:hypothetical protein